MEKDEGERGDGENETLLLPSLYGGGGSGVRLGEGIYKLSLIVN